MKTSGISFFVGALGLVAAVQATPQASVKRKYEPRVDERARYGFRNVVFGRVTDVEGHPLAGLSVGARFSSPQSLMPGEGGATTDTDGRYEIRTLGANDFSIGVGVRGTPYLVPAFQRANLRTATRLRRDFVLRKGPLVTVRVRDAETGSPIQGLDVRADRVVMDGKPIGKTGRDGTFSWHANTLEMEIALGSNVPGRVEYGPAPGYRFVKQVQLVAAKPFVWETKAYRNPFEPKPTTFRGQVVDERGAPVAGANVRLFQQSGTRTTTTNRQGRFELPGTRIRSLGGNQTDGGIVLLVDKRDLGATLRPAAERTWGEMRIVVRRGSGGEAVGRVVDEKGKPAASCPIVYWAFYGDDSAQFTVQPSNGGATDAQGRFLIRGLRSGGRYNFAFGGADWGVTHVPKGWPKSPAMGIAPGERKDLGTIVVPRAGNVVEGTMVAPGGGVVKGTVTLTLEGAHTHLTASPDAAGRFRFDRVAEEPLTLRAFASRDGFTRTGSDSPDLLVAQKAKAGDRRVRLTVKWRPAQP